MDGGLCAAAVCRRSSGTVMRRRGTGWGLLLGLVATLAPVAPVSGQAVDGGESERLVGSGAVLQGLDKVTATVTTFTVPLDTVVRFGSLDIVVRACEKAPPTEPPEQYVFLEIDETNPNVEAARVYSGWMFGSSPALAALEHPVYDVWVIDCMNASSPEGGNSQ